MLLLIHFFNSILPIMVKNSIYKRLGLLCCFGILLILCNCKSNSIVEDKDSTAGITSLETLIEKEVYYIDIEAMYPFNTAATTQVINALMLTNTGNSASRIDVGGEGYFIKIENDSVKAILPFFGERRLNAGNYSGRDGSIKIEGIAKEYEKIIKKKRLEINFITNQIDEPSEAYDVNLEIFPNKRVSVKIIPNYKTFISYSGILKPVIVESQ